MLAVRRSKPRRPQWTDERLRLASDATPRVIQISIKTGLPNGKRALISGFSAISVRIDKNCPPSSKGNAAEISGRSVFPSHDEIKPEYAITPGLS